MRQNNNFNKQGSVKSSDTTSGNIPNDIAAIGQAVDIIFSNLLSESELFAGTLVKGFHDAEGIFSELLKSLASLIGGGGSGDGDILGSLLGFIPGGNIIGGILDLFSMFDSPHQPGNAGVSQFDMIRSPVQPAPDITVIVNSEVESTKAVKFLTGHMPAYKQRVNGSAL